MPWIGHCTGISMGLNQQPDSQPMPVAHLSRLPGVQLEYLQHGHGPTRIMFLHGLEASARIWTGVQVALPPDQFTTIALNNRGAGKSDAPMDDSAYSIEAFAQDAHDLAHSLSWTRFALVGHSMGGATVAQFAVNHHAYLDALVLLNPASPDGRTGTPEQVEQRIDAFIHARRERLAREKLAAAADTARADSQLTDWRAMLHIDMANTVEQRLRGSLRSLHTIRISDRLRSIPVPTLLACGGQDDVIALDNMLATFARLPTGSRLQVWHQLGHSPNLEQPDTVADTLRQFMASLAAAA